MTRTTLSKIAAVAAGVTAAWRYTQSSNRRVVRSAFAAWSAGKGSLFDLITDDAVIVIPGVAPHCGTFGKAEFVRDVATPFMARFSKPPAPRARVIWSHRGHVAVLADAEGTARDGRRYTNSYVFVLKMRRGRIVQATEFLDMAAFNEVWDRVEPAPAPARQKESVA